MRKKNYFPQSTLCPKLLFIIVPNASEKLRACGSTERESLPKFFVYTSPRAVYITNTPHDSSNHFSPPKMIISLFSFQRICSYWRLYFRYSHFSRYDSGSHCFRHTPFVRRDLCRLLGASRVVKIFRSEITAQTDSVQYFTFVYDLLIGLQIFRALYTISNLRKQWRFF